MCTRFPTFLAWLRPRSVSFVPGKITGVTGGSFALLLLLLLPLLLLLLLLLLLPLPCNNYSLLVLLFDFPLRPVNIRMHWQLQPPRHLHCIGHIFAALRCTLRGSRARPKGVFHACYSRSLSLSPSRDSPAELRKIGQNCARLLTTFHTLFTQVLQFIPIFWLGSCTMLISFAAQAKIKFK